PGLPSPVDRSPSAEATASPSASPTPTAPDMMDDDGVVEPAAPATVSTAPAGPTPEHTAIADPESPTADASPTPQPEPSPGVSLGAGSWLDLGLIAALLIAVALVWAHRRRRYTPRKPTPRLRLDDPTVQPMPPVITRIRRALRQPAPTPVQDTDTPNDAADADPATHQPVPDDEAATRTTTVSPPVTPALVNPVIEVWPPAGLGLTGPGAEAAARGLLISTLAAGGLDEPNGRGYVIIPSGTLATLLGAAAVNVPDTPRLTVTGGLTDALTLLEEQTLYRTRMCFDHEVDTVSGLRDADPMAEPLPPMVLIADTTTAHARARIAALLTQGQRLDIHGILLGAWPDGDTVVVTQDGSTRPADSDTNRHGQHPADIGRLTVIDPAETADLLRILAESHTGDPQPPAPAEPAPPPAADVRPDTPPTDDDEPPHNEKKATPSIDLPESHRDAATDTVAPHTEQPTGHTTGGEQPAPDLPHDDDGSESPPPDDGAGAELGHVSLRVLGDARVVDLDTTQPLRGKSLELLVYLAARGGTASQEAILEDLLPESPASKAPHRLHTYVYNLRRVLKRTGGAGTYLSHPGQRYILHRDTVEVDLWQMSDALDTANRATTPADRITALQRAVDTYQGPLAAGKDYEWLDPYREAVQRQYVDAALALADALADQPADALAVLTTAISHSPYTEPLYRAAMHAHAIRGDTPAIRDLHRQLARSLDEIDTEVSDDTTSLARALVHRLDRSHRVGRDPS
ncbi:hypothetical protein C1I95_19275, partial [Micromonospora craterilacus]